MAYSPLAITRRHVLGDFYTQCDRIESIPVYLDETGGEVLGSVDEGLGHYADAFLFHLSEENCKKLSSGGFTYSVNCEYAKGEKEPKTRRRIILSSITLKGRKAYEKPGAQAATVKAVSEPVEAVSK